MSDFDEYCALFMENFNQISMAQQIKDFQVKLTALYRHYVSIGLRDGPKREGETLEKLLKQKIAEYVDFSNRHMDEILTDPNLKSLYMEFQTKYKDLLSMR